MEATWSLDELYESFESKAFKEDLAGAQKAVNDYCRWAEKNLTDRSNEKEKIETAIQMRLDMERYNLLQSFAHLSLCVNAEDEAAAKASDKIKVIFSNMTPGQVLFEKYVGGCEKLAQYISESPLLKEHAFYLNEIQQNNKYLLSEKEESLLAKTRITGSDAWALMREQINAGILVDFELDGQIKQLTLPMLINLSHSEDENVRKRAYEAELNCYKAVEKPVAAALNAIKGEVIAVSRLKGYETPLDMTLQMSRMERGTLTAMLEAMKSYLPAFHKFYRKKAELLGRENGLPFYDIFAPAGKVNMRYTYEEAADYVVKNFNDFSEELGSFARNAFDKRWIDVYPKSGKRGGAFCSGIHFLKECRILANFNGTFDSVLTLAHELGHGYHGYCLKDESMLNSSYTMPIAETASTFCETLTVHAALKEASAEEAFVILENEIAGCGVVVADIYSRFLFEDELFRRREEGSLSVEELKELMLECQKAAYGNGLDHSLLHPYMWINKVHYYYAGRNYYNFPYAYGQLFALGLFGIYQKEGRAFVPKYKEMLAATGKMNLEDVAASMGINVREKAFWESSLEIMAQKIEQFCSYK